MKLKLLSIIIFISCISLFLSLGFWQLDRAKEKDNIVNLYKNRQQAKIEKLTTISDNNISNLHYRNFVIKGSYINKVFLVDNKIKNLLDLKGKLKPLCNNFVDFGNYFSENIELD